MVEQLYSKHPELYDAIQSEWDYDRDVSFVSETLLEHDQTGTRLLEIGCGTGEHTRRFAEAGFDVTAVEPNEGMLSLAREKLDEARRDDGTAVEFRHDALPHLDVEGSFDVVVAVRGVLNHLPPEDLAPALEAFDRHLADDGVLIFDNSPLPPEGNHPALDVGTSDAGQYARIVQMNPTEGERLSWDAVVFTPGGEFFIDSYEMTPFDDVTIAAALSELGLAVEPVDGYGPDDHRTVFVAVA